MRWFQRANPTLWTLLTPPTVWALHFMVSYVVAAVYCAKADGPFSALGPARLTIGVATVLALAVIAAAGWQALRHAEFAVAERPHDDDTSADRDRQLGFATVLLSALSLVAVVFSALPALLIWDCR